MSRPSDPLLRDALGMMALALAVGLILWALSR